MYLIGNPFIYTIAYWDSLIVKNMIYNKFIGYYAK